MMVRNDSVLLDVYFYPYDGKAFHELASVTKSVMTTLIAIAADQGKLRLDQPIESQNRCSARWASGDGVRSRPRRSVIIHVCADWFAGGHRQMKDLVDEAGNLDEKFMRKWLTACNKSGIWCRSN